MQDFTTPANAQSVVNFQLDGRRHKVRDPDVDGREADRGYWKIILAMSADDMLEEARALVERDPGRDQRLGFRAEASFDRGRVSRATETRNEAVSTPSHNAEAFPYGRGRLAGCVEERPGR